MHHYWFANELSQVIVLKGIHGLYSNNFIHIEIATCKINIFLNSFQLSTFPFSHFSK